MKFTVQKELLLKTLQIISGAVERKQTLPVLGNVLLQARTHQLLLTTTDLEIEYIGQVVLAEPAQTGETTVSARKLTDICRALPDETQITCELKGEKVDITANKSRFSLVTISAEDFPKVEDTPGDSEYTLSQGMLHKLITDTQFAMAQQDVRYYLNGLLLQFDEGVIRSVATDGHRLALSEYKAEQAFQERSIIIPRKAVMELNRILTNNEEKLALTLSKNHLRIAQEQITLTTKLIDGRFPDYNRVIPRENTRIITVNREELHQTLSRVSILSHEKNKGVKMQLRQNTLQLTATNHDQEQAEEQLAIKYDAGDLDIGFNAEYVLNVLSVLTSEKVALAFADANSSLLITAAEDAAALYVIMPMRL